MSYDWERFHMLRKKKKDGTISVEELHMLDTMNLEAIRQDEKAAKRQEKALKPIMKKHKKNLEEIDSAMDELENLIDDYKRDK